PLVAGPIVTALEGPRFEMPLRYPIAKRAMRVSGLDSCNPTARCLARRGAAVARFLWNSHSVATQERIVVCQSPSNAGELRVERRAPLRRSMRVAPLAHERTKDAAAAGRVHPSDQAWRECPYGPGELGRRRGDQLGRGPATELAVLTGVSTG